MVIMDEDIKQNSTKRKILSAVISLIVVALLAFLSASLIKYYVTETFTVDGSSMTPTLSGGVYGNYDDGDRVVVNRFGKLKRGSIVVLKLPDRANALVKRVIGVSGDRIKIVDGVLFVNDEAQNEDYVAEENKYITNPSYSMPEITVSDGCVFVLGDNRNGSADSREFGEVPVDYIKGKVFMILLENGGFKFVK
jgi:signal peptidase I